MKLMVSAKPFVTHERFAPDVKRTVPMPNSASNSPSATRIPSTCSGISR